MSVVSPRISARSVGFFYLVIIATGMFAELGVRSRLVAPGDPAATAQNILANESLYRLGFVSELVTLLSATLVLVLLYDLVRVVGPRLARLALILNIVAIATQGCALACHYAPLILLKAADAGELTAEMQTLAYVSLRVHAVMFDIALTFFAFFCLAVGYLIVRSGFLPSLIGLLMIVAGVCYAVNSFTGFLAPDMRLQMLPWLLLPCLIGEAALALWLLAIGVNEKKWKDQAARFAESITALPAR